MPGRKEKPGKGGFDKLLDANTVLPKIEPNRYSYPGPFAIGSPEDPLNAYFSVPVEDRPLIMDGLELAARLAPTASDWSGGLAEGAFLDEELRKRYVSLADILSDRIRSHFANDSELADQKVHQYRGMFLSMIGTLYREQIAEALPAIRDYKTIPPST